MPPVLALSLYLPALAPSFYLPVLTPNLCLPILAPNLYLPDLAQICIYQAGPQLVFTDPDRNFAFTGLGP